MTNEEKYVAAAYLVVFAVVLAYVLIIAVKLGRMERALDEIEAHRTDDRREEEQTEDRS